MLRQFSATFRSFKTFYDYGTKPEPSSRHLRRFPPASPPRFLLYPRQNFPHKLGNLKREMLIALYGFVFKYAQPKMF